MSKLGGTLEMYVVPVGAGHEEVPDDAVEDIASV
jgi:hypothetical protein